MLDSLVLQGDGEDPEEREGKRIAGRDLCLKARCSTS